MICSQFYQIKIAIEKLKFSLVNLLKTESDVQVFKSNLERELSIISGLFENLKHILGGDPTIFQKEILDVIATQYEQSHQNQIDL